MQVRQDFRTVAAVIAVVAGETTSRGHANSLGFRPQFQKS